MLKIQVREVRNISQCSEFCAKCTPFSVKILHQTVIYKAGKMRKERKKKEGK